MTKIIGTLILFFITGCTPNQATPIKYKACESLCKSNGGTYFVQLYNRSILIFDVNTSNRFDCRCNNGAQFLGLDINKMEVK